MTTRLLFSALLLAASVLAEAQSSGVAGSPALPRLRPPAANAAENIEPAVDVGGARAGDLPAASPTGTARVAADRPSSAAPAAAAAASGGKRTEPAAPKPAAAPAGSRVMDTLDLGTTSITGNQELPKVLYIVPWKKSDLGDLVGRPVNTLLDEVLEPVDPEVFERHLEYYQALYGNSENSGNSGNSVKE